MKKTFRRAAVMGLLLTLIITSIVLAESPMAGLPGSGWWTGAQFQNVGTAAANVSIQPYGANAPAATSTTIDPGASKTFLPADLSLPTGFEGAAVVSADQSLNAIVNVTNREVAGYGVAGGAAAAQYQGVSGTKAANELNFPLVKNNSFGKSTSFYIQNAGTATTNATAVFRASATGTAYTKTLSIPAGNMALVTPADAPGYPTGDNVSVGSLTVTADQPLAGVVLEYAPAENPALILQGTRGLTPGDRDTKLFAPIIKKDYVNRFTGIQVQNAGTTATNVTVSYSGISAQCGTIQNETFDNLAPGASHTFVQLTGQTTLPDGCLASATVTSSGSPIVAIVNEAYVPGRRAVQEGTTYYALPLNAGTTKLSAPLYKEKSNNKTTGLLVQNVGTASTKISATFTNADGDTYTTQQFDVAAGAGFNLLTVSENAANWAGTPMPSNISGTKAVFGVVVTSDGQPIVAIANESTYPFSNPPFQQDKNNYEAFNLQP